MKIFRKIKLLFFYGDELEKVLRNLRMEKIEKEYLERQSNLRLCYKHKQEENRSIYDEKNCDYCKLSKENEKLRLKLDEKIKS